MGPNFTLNLASIMLKEKWGFINQKKKEKIEWWIPHYQLKIILIKYVTIPHGDESWI